VTKGNTQLNAVVRHLGPAQRQTMVMMCTICLYIFKREWPR